VTLRLRLDLPDGCDLAQGSRVSLFLSARGELSAPDSDQGFEVGRRRRGIPVLVQAPAEGEATLELRLEAVLCRHGEAAACRPVQASYRLPLRIEPGGAAALDVKLRLPAPGC
jgi:hypothetical protein